MKIVVLNSFAVVLGKVCARPGVETEVRKEDLRGFSPLAEAERFGAGLKDGEIILTKDLATLRVVKER